MLVDVAARSLRTLVNNRQADVMIYSLSRRLLYAVLEDPNEDTFCGVVCSTDPSTGVTHQLDWAKKKDVRAMYGITSDDRFAIVRADELTRPPDANPLYGDLWAVNLDDGEYTLIARDAECAVVLPPLSLAKLDKD